MSTIVRRNTILAIGILAIGIIGVFILAAAAATQSFAANDCTSPTSLRVSDRADTPNLAWQNNAECPGASFNVYRLTDAGKTLIGTTPGLAFEDTAPPSDGYLAYVVRGVINGVENGGVAYTVREMPLQPDPEPSLPGDNPADAEMTLVCFYAQNGSIHSVSGARECTMAEIAHVLSQQ